MNTYQIIIESCKEGEEEGFLILVEKFMPLIKKYTRLLYKDDAGVTGGGTVSPYILQGIMNTDAYSFNGEPSTHAYYCHLVQRDMNNKYGLTFGLVAPNGIWERKSHKMLIKCCQKEWGIANPDGVWGDNTKSKAPTLSTKTGTSSFEKTRLLQWALTINGFYPGTFSGVFTNDLKNIVHVFQEFMCIDADGIVGKGTWASLLSSKGDTSRSLKAFDTASRVTASQAQYFKEHGYTDIGRYLVNASGNNVLDKKMTIEELKYISETGLKVFPIYQTRGNNVGYFANSSQGLHDAAEAEAAARNLFFPNGTTIYFAVDYDVKTADIEKYIVPYFRNINLGMNNYYKVGVYGPRAICNILADQGLTSASFVADMSSGFTCNIGQPMPKNWAYEQVVEVKQGGIGIDKCAVSPRGTAIEWNLKQYTPVNDELADAYEAEFTNRNAYDEEKHEFTPGSPYAIVYGRLMKTELNIYAVAGIMGNLQAEGFDPEKEDANGAFGIAQWQGPRRDNLRSYAGSYEKMKKTEVQIEFLLHECTHGVTYSDPQAADGMDLLLKNNEVKSARYASDIFTSSFERPTNHATWNEVENAYLNCKWDTVDRYEEGEDGKNAFDGIYYIDSKKRRGCAEACYRYLIDIEKNH